MMAAEVLVVVVLGILIAGVLGSRRKKGLIYRAQ